MSNITPESRALKIKIILFDVDGVLTDGQLFVLPNSDGSGTELKGFPSRAREMALASRLPVLTG